MTETSELRQELALAERHVLESEARIARQAEVVRALEADGHDTAQAQELLAVLEQALSAIDTHRRQIVRELARARDASTGPLT